VARRHERRPTEALIEGALARKTNMYRIASSIVSLVSFDFARLGEGEKMGIAARKAA